MSSVARSAIRGQHVLSSHRVLTMSFEEGVSITDAPGLRKMGLGAAITVCQHEEGVADVHLEHFGAGEARPPLLQERVAFDDEVRVLVEPVLLLVAVADPGERSVARVPAREYQGQRGSPLARPARTLRNP